MNHRAIRINPEADRALQITNRRVNCDTSGFQIQHLPKRRSLLEERLVETDSNPSQLHQFGIRATAGPGITFGKVENQITGRLDPHIGSKVAISNRHGTVVILAGRVPDDIVFFQESFFARQQCGHGMNAGEK